MKEFRKVDYAEYKDTYDEAIREKLHSSAADIEIESMRASLYGYTFSENYARGVTPDELSMDYWRDKVDEVWDCDDPRDIDISKYIAIVHGNDMKELVESSNIYNIATVQEKRILQAIDSTGDGKSSETALCVIDVWQEYEYIRRVYPYTNLTLKGQSVSDGIDCLEFEPNDYGVERIFFDVRRRFEVGYSLILNS